MIRLPHLTPFAITMVLLFSQCQSHNDQRRAENLADSVLEDTVHSTMADSLVAVLTMDSLVNLQDSLLLRFTVYNPTDDTLRFTEYHTPFEGFMNNFLTITHRDGHDAPYIGPMAKRVMPPVEESFHTVLPNDRLSVTIDLKGGYRFDKPGTYTIEYTGGHVSGIASGEAIDVVVEQQQ